MITPFLALVVIALCLGVAHIIWGHNALAGSAIILICAALLTR